MKEIYFKLVSLLTKTVNGYSLNSNEYFQLRMFIDSLSQNQKFGKIANDTFGKIKNDIKVDTSQKSIDMYTIYNILNKFYPEFISQLTDETSRSKIYSEFNSLRNQDYRNYVELMTNSLMKDFEIDNGRIKFQYIYVTANVGSYIMLLDNVIFLENLDELRLKKGLREFTNLGNIKRKQDADLSQLNDELNFESCFN